MSNFSSLIEEDISSLIKCTVVNTELCLHLSSSKLITPSEYEKLKKFVVSKVYVNFQSLQGQNMRKIICF